MKRLILFSFLFLICLVLNSSITYSQSGWVVQSTPFIISDFQFINSQTGFISGDQGKVAKTTDGGNSWSLISIPLNLSVRGIYFSNLNTGVAITYKQAPTQYPPFIKYLFKTTNGGLTWDSTFKDAGYVNDSKVYMLNKDTILTLEDGWADPGIIGMLNLSTNGGITFNRVINTFEGFYSLKFINNKTGWVCTHSASDFGPISTGVYKTINSGINWNRIYIDSVSSTTIPTTINSISFLNNNTGFIGGAKGRFAKTTNSGLEWIDRNFSNRFSFADIHFFDEFTGYAGITRNNTLSDSSGIYRTTNAGISWAKMTNSPLTSIYRFKFINDLTGWASGYSSSTGDALIKTVTGGLTAVEQISSILPEKFSLKQNYPNPFNPTTKINYDIQISGDVSLKVYDAVGNEVETLVNENQNGGSYSVSFNAGNYPSGVYFYKLTAGSFSETRKMLVVK